MLIHTFVSSYIELTHLLHACPNTLATSYRVVAVSAPGSVAAQAEIKKIAK